jgi:esterase/lipase superfamily enzyme
MKSGLLYSSSIVMGVAITIPPRISTMSDTRLLPIISLAALLGVAGCATTYPLMPTPALYTGAQARRLFTEAPAEVRTPPLDLLFITDRAPATATSSDEPEPYTADRSRAMSFGSTTIVFGENMTWDALEKQSLLVERGTPMDMKLGPTKQLGSYPRVPYQMTVSPAGISRTPAAIDGHETANRELQAEIARRLALSPRKEMVLFIHGYSNTFTDAATTMGEICHYLGREFVCGIFTWPAGGKKGILMGYNEDVESSVFATEHLRKAIRTIAGTPGLAKLHVLAHSRGTDLLATVLSELSVEAYMEQKTLTERFKIGNVVLMAPDIDIDVAPLKILAIVSDPDLPYGAAPNPRVVVKPSPGFNITVYTSPDDKALAASGWLFGSLSRLGRVEASKMTPEQIEQARALGVLDVIQVRGTTDFFGHGYFHSNPRVSADLIALLRYGLRPNEPGRPLDELKRPFWRVPEAGTKGGAGGSD